MRSTFFGLNIGYSGLATQQRALDVTGHNIANSNTPGYTRQDVIMEPGVPLKVLQGYVGTGVEITEFRRIRDQYLDIQLRTENRTLGEWETKTNILGKLEVIYNEPSESSLRSVMDSYWEKWQLVAKSPENVASRDSAMQSGISLAETFNHMAKQFTDLQEDINSGIAIKVDEINTLGRQIRDLNVQVIKAEADGSKANDLRDRRDLLVEQLSKISEISVTEDELGAVNISMGGRYIVARAVHTEAKFVEHEHDATKSEIQWLDPKTGNPIGVVNIKGGQLKGYIDMRDQTVPHLHQEISELARRIATEVNILHRQGYATDGSTERDFFVKIDENLPFSAANIQVNPDVVSNSGLIAAAAAATALDGDGDNALLIAQLRNKATMGMELFEPQASVRGTAITGPVDIMADSNQLSITLNGVTKDIFLTVGTYATPADLAAELENELNDPAAFGPGAVSVTVDGANQLVITNNFTGPNAGIYDISGPGAVALGIADKNRATFDDYFRSSVAKLGVSTMEAERMLENQNILTSQLVNKREAISGVSLDEEMTNMIRFQHAYTAAARVITTMDEMLDLIVNRLGLVGR